jgi:RHS repeat-associated protein
VDRHVSERETHQGKTPRTTSLTYRGLSKDTTEEVQKDDSGTLITTKDYTYDAYGHRLSMTNTPNGQPSQTFTYGYNVHDSVSQLIDSNGNATASYGYRPYGDADTGQTQGDTDTKNPTNAYRYGAKRFDSGSGTLDTGARRFGPDTGHFLQQDVFHGALADLALGTDPISQNRYAMAGGNPLSYIEWDGHMALVDGGGGGISVNPSSRDACADMCDSHVTVGASASTNGGSAHKQADNNPLKQLGDWFGGAKKSVEDKAKQAGQWVYDHSSEISAIAGTAAVVTAFIPGVDAISPALFAVSAVTGVMAAHKDMRQGNYGAAALDMLAVIPGGGALGAGIKDARAAVTVGKDLKVLGGVTEAAAKEGGAGKAAGEVCNLFNSFTPNTPVLLASGKKVRIDQVKVGDKVLAQDPKSGRQAAEPVERIIIGRGLKHLVTIATPGGTIVATDAHPFYVREAHDFVTAGQLQSGEQLELSTGDWATIASVQHQDQVLRVYNLSVGQFHTFFFFAGQSSMLVHNCGITADSRALTHVLDRHFEGGRLADLSRKSIFSSGEDLPSLLREAEGTERVQQEGGNFVRTVFAGRAVGAERKTGQMTMFYSVITDTDNSLVTAFPGFP